MTHPTLHPLCTPEGESYGPFRFRLVDDGIGSTLEIMTPGEDWLATTVRYAYRVGVVEDAVATCRAYAAKHARDEGRILPCHIADGAEFPGWLSTRWSPVNQAYLIVWGDHQYSPVLALCNSADEAADYLNFLYTEVAASYREQEAKQ